LLLAKSAKMRLKTFNSQRIAITGEPFTGPAGQREAHE
jgi:hypothetical protein